MTIIPAAAGWYIEWDHGLGPPRDWIIAWDITDQVTDENHDQQVTPITTTGHETGIGTGADAVARILHTEDDA